MKIKNWRARQAACDRVAQTAETGRVGAHMCTHLHTADMQQPERGEEGRSSTIELARGAQLYSGIASTVFRATNQYRCGSWPRSRCRVQAAEHVSDKNLANFNLDLKSL